MKSWLIVASLILCDSVWAAPAIKASAAVLMDFDTGKLLFAKNPTLIRQPASTTKMMTAALVIERCNLDDWVTAGPNVETVTGSSLHLKPGEKLRVRDLLYAILLRSGNDACVAAAEHVSGSVPKFADLMNRRAKEIGMKHTHFTNPHGLNDPLHYTTAQDLAILARFCMQHQVFCDIVGAQKQTISRSLNSQDLLIRNHNRLLGKYPGLEGIKTGYTAPAGHCFVGSASRRGWRIISVVMHSPNWQAETKALLNYGFRQFRSVQVTAPEVHELRVVGAVHAVTVLPVPPFRLVVERNKREPVIVPSVRSCAVDVPVRRGQTVGWIDWKQGSVLVGTQPLIAAETVPAARATPTRRYGLAIAGMALFLAALIRRKRLA